MKKNLRIFSTIIFVSVLFSALAQNNVPQKDNSNNPYQGTSERCKSNIIHQELLKTDPQYAARIQQNEQKIQTIINSAARSGGVYTIPVVVHVLHKGEAVGTGTNISTAQINSAIANLNDCYGGNGSYPLDIQVQFQLAQRAPDCSATTGIVRIDASGVSDYDANGITSANEETIKAISKWPNGEYYNIWIVSEIDNNGGGAGTQGYAYFPGAGADVDGSVILYNSFGYDPTGALGYNLKSYTKYNATTNHELGHAFNLYHTFQGDDGNSDGNPDQCPANGACTTDGDKCCDTEAHRRDDGDCGDTGPSCNGGALTNVVQNIMAYSSDVCQVQFTNDQKTRIRAAIEGARASLLTSPALIAISGSEPAVVKSCSPQSTDINNSFGMGVFGLTIDATTYSSSGTVADGGFRNNWCSNFNLNVNTLYSIQVDNGSLNNEKVRVYIDYNNDGDFLDADENIYTDNSGALTHSGNFTTPASPVTGQALWVRVISDFVGNTISGPCYTPQYGQVEDFSVIFPNGGCTPPTVNTVPVSPGCNGGSNGSATANPSGGTSPYTYLWNTGATTQAILNVGAGTYTVTVTDDVGCSASKTAVVANPAALSLNTVIQPSSCSDNDGAINLTVSGGSPGYSYNWSNGITTEDINGLSQGSYTVTVTDANSCTAQKVTNVVMVCVPSTQVANSQCGQTVPDLSGSFFCNTVAGVQDYEWEFVNAGLGYSFTKKRGAPINSIQRTLIIGLKPGTTYDVRVRALVAGIWGNFGTICTITLSATIPLTKVTVSQCGQTLPTLSGQFYCNAVAGAQDYEWEFVNAGLGYSYTRKRGAPTNYIDRLLITGLKPGVSYDVRVRAMIGGIWGNFGQVCTIMISASIPLTMISASQCGQTLPTLGGQFYCNAVAGAQDYEWEFVNAGLGYSYTRKRGAPTNYIDRLLITGLKLGVPYNVRVRAMVGGIWGNFGSVCSVTISSIIPLTKVATSQCGQTVPNLLGQFYCDAVAGAQDYEWEFTNAGLGYSYTRKRGGGATYIDRVLIAGVQYGASYDVRVRAMVDGSWGNFGSICVITISSPPPIITNDNDYDNINFKEPNFTTTVINNKENNIKIIVYPNPSSNSGFNINLEGMTANTAHDAIIDIYDMYGKLILTKSIQNKTGEQFAKINENGFLATGIYLMNININGQFLQQKIIVQ